jgi:hypothetical protein
VSDGQRRQELRGREPAGDQGQAGADPGEEGALVGQGEAVVGRGAYPADLLGIEPLFDHTQHACHYPVGLARNL